MRSLLLSFFLLLVLILDAQEVRVIVPEGTVVTGTAFQVQYVVSGAVQVEQVQAPAFTGFRLVSGPNLYEGRAADGAPVHNITFTLVPLQAGTLEVEALTLQLPSGSLRSGRALVRAVAPTRERFSAQSNYTDATLYAPAARTDLEALIRNNLFIRAATDRKSVRVGEPVVVSFTLYSRLQSESEVVKVPGFYGFSVVDLLPEGSAPPGIDTIGNRLFNSHLLRKVQLYPVQAGTVDIEPLQAATSITFLDSAHPGSKLRLERLLQSNPLRIDVAALPAPPAGFVDGVGNFLLQAIVGRKPDGLHELTLVISGKGNFIQLTPPVVAWPRGFEPFEPVVEEDLDPTSVPVSGRKIYRYAFAADSMGSFQIPPVQLTYFDPARAAYATTRTDSLRLDVGVAGARSDALPSMEADKKETGSWWWWLLLPLAGAAGWWVLQKQKPQKPVTKETTQAGEVPALAHLQQVRALDAGALSQPELCSALQRILSDWLRQCHGITSLAPDVWKEKLAPGQVQRLQHIFNACTQALYAGVRSETDKNGLKREAEALLEADDR